MHDRQTNRTNINYGCSFVKRILTKNYSARYPPTLPLIFNNKNPIKQTDRIIISQILSTLAIS